MYLLTQNQGALVMLFAGAPALGPGATVSKNGGGFAGAANVPADVGNGWYSLALNFTETDTIGPLCIHLSAGTPADFLFQVGALVDANCVEQLGQVLPAQIGGLPPVHVADLANDAVSATKVASDVVAKLFSGAALIESYAVDGAAATPAQLLYALLSALTEFSIAAATLTCKKLDGATTSMVFTLSPAGNPTSRTRSS